MDDEAKGKLTRRELLALLAVLTATPSEAAAPPMPAPDPVNTNPRSYRVAFENDKLRVLEYRSRPGLGVCGQGLHYHPEHLTIAVSGGKFRARAEDGKLQEGQAPPGFMFWAPAEVHEVENLSGREMLAYIVEVKSRGWKPSTG